VTVNGSSRVEAISNGGKGKREWESPGNKKPQEASRKRVEGPEAWNSSGGQQQAEQQQKQKAAATAEGSSSGGSNGGRSGRKGRESARGDSAAIRAGPQQERAEGGHARIGGRMPRKRQKVVRESQRAEGRNWRKEGVRPGGLSGGERKEKGPKR
jgi:hypothetical protein